MAIRNKINNAAVSGMVAAGMSVSEMAAEFNVTKRSMKLRLNKLGLKTRGMETCMTGCCAVCGKLLKGKQTKFCSSECKCKFYEQHLSGGYAPYDKTYQTRRAIIKKLSLLHELGHTKCCKCGYDKNISALVFHHEQPSAKKFELSARACATKSNAELLEEAKKCTVLCANCHAELHHPTQDMEIAVAIYNGSNKNISIKNYKTSEAAAEARQKAKKAIADGLIDVTKEGWSASIANVAGRSPAWATSFLKENYPDLYKKRFLGAYGKMKIK